VKLVTVWPEASRTLTCIAGVITPPAVTVFTVSVGCTVKKSWVGSEGMMVKAALVATGSPAAEAVKQPAEKAVKE